MKELITKSLFDAIYNCDISKDNDMLRYYNRINMYDEFTFKCKEWILSQKNKDCFYIADQFSLNIESQMGVIKYFWCVLLKNNSRVSPEFKADSEIETIIKACNWILEMPNEKI